MGRHMLPETWRSLKYLPAQTTLEEPRVRKVASDVGNHMATIDGAAKSTCAPLADIRYGSFELTPDVVFTEVILTPVSSVWLSVMGSSNSHQGLHGYRSSECNFAIRNAELRTRKHAQDDE